MKINISHIEPESYIYAPGKQFVIWMQGCSIHCDGCWNQEMWSFEKNNYVETEELIRLTESNKAIEGVTFLGGEPFDQENELAFILEKLRKMNLGITVYTGYELKELKTKKRQEILNMIDLLICGRYNKKLRNSNLQWIGSENQSILYLTPFYKQKENQNGNYCEITINDDGSMTVIGFPEMKLIKSIRYDQQT